MQIGLKSLSINGTNRIVTPTATTLASLEPYRTSATSFGDVPWGPYSWVESGSKTQDMDINIPSGTAPGPGWPVIMYFHPNGSTKDIVFSEHVALKADALAKGFAFISSEFRHPYVNVSLGAPHTDAGLAIQFARSLAAALNLDTSNFFGVTQSRGTLALWQALQADRANPGGPTWASRQSSLLKGIWSYQGQTTYSTTQMANLFIIPGDRTAFLTANPDDVRFGSALDSVAAASAWAPHLVMLHRDTYHVGLVPAASFDEHWPGFGAEMDIRYASAGISSRFAKQDNRTPVAAFVDAVDWCALVKGGATGSAAAATVGL
jgi:hypothetical protein